MIRAILALFLAGAAFGQSGPQARRFEVASVKLHEGPMHVMGVQTSGQRLTADAANVRMLIMYAYGLKNFQISWPAPLWNDGDAFWDIVAKAEGDGIPTQAEFREMLQSLLAERFHLQFHRETHDMPVYALVVGKKGPKLKESAPDAVKGGRMTVEGRNYRVTRTAATMSGVVDVVANAFLDRPVVDRTGLTGT